MSKRDLLTFLAGILFSILMVAVIKTLNLPTFITFTISIITSYALVFLAMLRHIILKSGKIK